MMYTLITGACGGLGSAFCRVLAARGEPLFLTGRSDVRLRALAEELRAAHGIPVETFVCDLRRQEERQALFAYADVHGIALHGLVYVAGADTQMAFEKYTEEMLVFQARVDFEGAVSMASGFLARCPHDGSSKLLTIGSMSGVTPMPYFALYSASKKALEQFSSGLHGELRGKVKVTCVLPGSIPTREDIRENIKSHGLFGRLSALPPETVAVRSLKAAERNRRVCVIGGWNRLLFFAMHLVPVRLRMRVIEKIWKKTEKDHFS